MAAGKGDVFLDPAKAGPDFKVQGEYLGENSEGERIGLNIVALGDGKFKAVGFEGGLPGDGWTKENEKHAFTVATKDGMMVFKEKDGVEYTASLKGGKLTSYLDGKGFAVLKKVTRKSPTLGKKAPKGAVVLFDGDKHGADLWKKGRQTEDGLLMEGCTSKQTFSDFKIHIEFRTPYKPKARGQGRGNSGFYAHGRYEVQVLDSFGEEGRHNECGGIYSTKPPLLNMCYPPLSWQTYDIDFTAAKFKEGKKVANAIMTVHHNGVLILHINMQHFCTLFPCRVVAPFFCTRYRVLIQFLDLLNADHINGPPNRIHPVRPDSCQDQSRHAHTRHCRSPLRDGQALVDVIWAFQAMDPPGGGGALGPAVLFPRGVSRCTRRSGRGSCPGRDRLRRASCHPACAPGRGQRRAGACRAAGRHPDRATIASGALRK